MPDSMRFDNNGQPMGYGDPMDPYAQYQQQGAYPGAMPSPQELYGQQYADPNQMYMDPNQMYGAQPMQQDPYGQYPQQGAYMDPNAGMAAPAPYPEMDPAMAAQPYVDPNAQYMQQPMPDYGQAAQPYPANPAMGGQPYGQMPQQQMPQQAMPTAAPQPEPAMDKKAAKRQKRAAKPVPTGPAPSAGKATLCMILGIFSVIFALIPPIGIALGLVVRHMSGSYMDQGGTSPKADTGRIFGTVGLVFSLIMLAIYILLGVFIYAGMYGEAQARTWAVFYNNSPFGNIIRIPIPNPLG